MKKKQRITEKETLLAYGKFFRAFAVAQKIVKSEGQMKKLLRESAEHAGFIKEKSIRKEVREAFGDLIKLARKFH